MHGHQRLYIQTVCLARRVSGSLSEVVLNKGEPGTWLSLFSVRAVAGLPVKSVCLHIWGPAVRMWWECEVVAGRTAPGHSNDGCPLSHSPRGHSQFLSLLPFSVPRSTISSVDCPHLRFSTAWVPSSLFPPMHYYLPFYTNLRRFSSQVLPLPASLPSFSPLPPSFFPASALKQ